VAKTLLVPLNVIAILELPVGEAAATTVKLAEFWPAGIVTEAGLVAKSPVAPEYARLTVTSSAAVTPEGNCTV
jgi:hypothetical protein